MDKLRGNVVGRHHHIHRMIHPQNKHEICQVDYKMETEIGYIKAYQLSNWNDWLALWDHLNIYSRVYTIALLLTVNNYQR